jgi:rhodanese-related sulfurtransferase
MHYRTTNPLQMLGIVLAFMFTSGQATAEQRSATSIPTTELIQPAELASILGSASAKKPVLLHVGFRKLYSQSHIPGSDYVGPTSDAAGLQLLNNRVAKLGKDTDIVIYCGCCPWTHCPNLASAYEALHKQGFTHVRALYIERNFGDDWVSHGYPATKGE